MNARPTNCEREMGDLIDALVCGEIDEAARGRLIAWLEAEPPRWRLCGLAFLESQIWSHALDTRPSADRGAGCQPAEVGGRAGFQPAEVGDRRAGFQPAEVTRGVTVLDCAAASAEPVAGLQPAPRQVAGGQPALRARLGYAAALAASVLVAFGLGVVWAELFGSSSTGSAPMASGRMGNADERPVEPKIAAADEDSDKPPSAHEPTLAAFTARVGGVETTVHVPVRLVGDASHEMAAAPPALPDYVRRQWERCGFDVQTQRRYLFPTLPTGERVVMPVDDLKFNPIPIHVY